MLVARLASVLSDRAGSALIRGQFSLCHSSIIICSSAPLCLLALSLFITVLPLSACQRCLPCTLMQLAASSSSGPTSTHSIPTFFLFFRLAVRASPLRYTSLRSHLSRCSVLVSFLLLLRQETWAMSSLGSAFGCGTLTENFRTRLYGERQWGKEGIEGGDESLCHVCGLTVGSTLQFAHRGEKC